jgi:hypothetical protein
MTINSSATPPDGPVIGQSPQGQLIQFTFTQGYPLAATKKFLPEQHVGAVLTMLAGPAASYSTHIVGMVGTTQLQITAFEGVNSSDVITYINNCGGNGCPCLINGTPYSGTGFGFNPAAVSAASLSSPSPPQSYNTATDGNSSAIDGGAWPFALLPNHAAFPYTVADPCYNPSSTYVNWLNQLDPAGPGGANPDYTAPDYQNMYLALRLAQPTGNAYGLTPIPSFHRPELVNYWANWKNPSTGKVDWNDTTNGPILQRKVMLRPMYAVKIFNPTTGAFATGTILNPGMPDIDPINGPWDVCNAGDGYADSVWIDPGYEIRSTPDGRLYKPLVAILCVDLDGRLNLNAHGSLAQTQTSAAPSGGDFDLTPNIGSTLLYGGNTVPPQGSLPHGQMGWGPADINLSPLFAYPLPGQSSSPTAAVQQQEYQQLLAGMSSGGLLLDGRYGESNLSGNAPPYNLPSPGYSTNNANGSADDYLSANKEFDYPSNYQYALGANAASAADARSIFQGYGMPGDLQGMLATGLDYRGQPVYGALNLQQPIDPLNNNPGSTPHGCYSALCGNWTFAGRVNNPYELDLSLRQPRGLRSPASPDNPFSPFELERILRPYDRDTMTLPSRLLTLAPSLANASAGMSAKVTTDSYDLPCPNLAAPANLLPYAPGILPSGSGSDGRIRHFTDLVKAAVNAAANNTSGGVPATFNAASMTTVLPLDVLSDLRMDINRPFGNGVDDNGNGVVDEPAEADSGVEQMPYVTPPGVSPPNNSSLPNPGLPRMDYADSGVTPTATAPPADPRQLCFRYLYVLGMMLTDPAAAPPGWFQSTLPGTPPIVNAMSVPSSASNPPLEIRARWIAQWAANVVSFRDRDSIMKPFAYDPNVLTNLANPTGSPNGLAWSPPDQKNCTGQHIVFSCERPELLITETLAFHEKRTEVFADNEKPNPQQLLMQHMRPQGSLFIELYNPWSATEAPPAEFYYDRTNAANSGSPWQHGVVLNQTAQGSPVWRLIIPVDTSTSKMPINADPDDPSVSATLSIERSIYFTNPGSLNDGAQVQFYPSGTGAQLPVLLHNHYALLGPPSSDPNGSWLSKSSNGQNAALIMLDPTKYSPSQNPTTWPVQVLNNSTSTGQNDLPVAQSKQPLPILIDKVANAGAAASPPRFSISEPVGGYPVPSGGQDPTSGDPQYFTAPPSPAPGAPPLQPPYQPLDTPSSTNTVTPEMFNSQAVGVMYGRYPACRVVHLQRLANPLLPYQPQLNASTVTFTSDGQINWAKSTYNPYRTIDSMPIDLTVYNGWETSSNLQNLSQQAPCDTEIPAMTAPFCSRQRGDFAFWTLGGTNTTGTYLNNLWAQEWQPLPSAAYPAALTGTTIYPPVTKQVSSQMFPFQLRHTLAYVNYGYGMPYGGSQEYLGDPSLPVQPPAQPTVPLPFPWLTWNNRPFCSPMELMLVPAMSSSQLLCNYSIINTAGPAAETGAPVAATTPYTFANQPFGQLLNFFHCQQPPPPGTSQFPIPAQFYRILEYLRVPSRFVGTEVQVNPAYCGDNTGVHQFHPPYNRISRYRDPGRINLNTLTDPDVWNGLMQSAPGLASNPQAFASFLLSRRGYAMPQAPGSYTDFFNTKTELNSACPTLFGNPLRSFEGAHLVPIDVLYQTATCQPPTPGTAANPGLDINATLLRQDPTPSTGQYRPLFGFDAGIAGSGIPGSKRQYNNDQRNPYFRYQNLQRLGNLVTTRSNVFAVWITVGYFQVQKVPPGTFGANQQFLFPDGYQIIGELGADTGEVKRHRAFYIFDRSIPMGYQRGHDNNVSSGILVSRLFVWSG